MSHRDLSKRIVLFGEKPSQRSGRPNSSNPRRKSVGQRKVSDRKFGQKNDPLESCGKSKSFEEGYDPGSPVRNREELEMKRRSIYGRECRGRHSTKPCNRCQTVAVKVTEATTRIWFQPEFWTCKLCNQQPVQSCLLVPGLALAYLR